MPIYSVRLFCEASPDPVSGELRDVAEETLVVDAPSLWAAKTAATMRMTIRPMGRVLMAYDAATGHGIEPPAPGGLLPGRFQIDGLPGTYDGFTRGETWNGFAVPFFPLVEARRIADDYAAQPAGLDGQTEAEYDAARDLVRLYDPSSGVWDEYGRVEIYDGSGHGPRALYPIGAMYWTWTENESSSMNTEAPNKHHFIR